MSWHCAFCGDSDNEKQWCKIMVAPMCGIASHFVCHIECLKDKFHCEADDIKDQMDSHIKDCEECNENDVLAEKYKEVRKHVN